MSEPSPITIYQQRSGPAAFLPFELPPTARGKWEIKHEIRKAGEELTVVSMRNAIFMGLRPAKLVLKEDAIVHYLHENGKGENGLWMSTNPQEIEQHERQLKRAKGRVLVGGLGLGLAVGILSRNKKVREIVVVERDADVIHLVARHLPRAKRLTVVHADLYKYLRDCKKGMPAGGEFDFAFLDIWCPTGQSVLTEHCMPLRRLCRGVVKRQADIECWNEDEMVGQVLAGCEARIGFMGVRPLPGTEGFGMDILKMPADQFKPMRKFNREAYPFLKWMRQTKPSQDEARYMLRCYGMALKDTDAWDKFWKRYDK